VYLAEMSTGSGFVKNVAVKVLREDVQEHEQVAARLRDEAKLLGMLRHPAIVQADDLINLAGRPAVVMEYVPGVNLSWLINPQRCTARMPPRVAFTIARHVASALDAAYARPSDVTGRPLGVLHRDIKPGNVRITADGAVKVLDFGIARSEHKGRETDTKDYQLGSLHYMAPEMMAGQPASPASDVYALGVVLFEALARLRLGWAAESPLSHDVHVQTRLEQADLSAIPGEAWNTAVDLLTRLLAYEPARRPSAREAAAAFRQLEDALEGPALDEWVRSVLPSVVPPEEPQDADLSGKVLFEEASHVTPTGSFPGAEEPTEPTRIGPAGGGKGPMLAVFGGVAAVIAIALLLGLGAGWYLLLGPGAGERAPSTSLPASTAPPAVELPALRPPPLDPAPAAVQPVATPEPEPAPAPVPAPRREPQAAKPAAPASTPTPAPPPPAAAPVAMRLASMPFGLEVRVDGVLAGTTPLSLEVAPGPHRLEFVSGGEVIARDVEVVPGQENLWTYNSMRGDIR
jgi:hypothetical protein